MIAHVHARTEERQARWDKTNQCTAEHSFDIHEHTSPSQPSEKRPAATRGWDPTWDLHFVSFLRRSLDVQKQDTIRFMCVLGTKFTSGLKEKGPVCDSCCHCAEGNKKSPPFLKISNRVKYQVLFELINPNSKIDQFPNKDLPSRNALNILICWVGEWCQSSYQAVLIEKRFEIVCQRLFFNWESSSKSVTCGCAPSSPR